MRRKSRHYAHLLAATDLSQSLRSALEFGAGVAALMIVTAFAANSIQSAVLRTQTIEAFSLTSAVKAEMIVHHAVHGEWPTDADDLASSPLQDPFELGKYVDRIELGDAGVLTVVFDADDTASGLRSGQLSYRPASLADNPGTPVLWVCGRHRPLDGFVASGTDRTTIDNMNLPSVCREH